MYVWDHSPILDNRLYESNQNVERGKKSHKRIRDIISSTAVFGDTQSSVHNPYRTCLSYQTVMAYWKWSKERNNDLEEPTDFDDSTYEGNFKTMRLQYITEDIKKNYYVAEMDEENESKLDDDDVEFSG